jgi:hypothetical protein
MHANQHAIRPDARCWEVVCQLQDLRAAILFAQDRSHVD